MTGNKKIPLKWAELNIESVDVLGRLMDMTKIIAGRSKKKVVKVWYHPDLGLVSWHVKKPGGEEYVRVSPMSRVIRLEFLKPLIP